MVKSEKEITENFCSDEEQAGGGGELIISLLFKAIFIAVLRSGRGAGKLFYDRNC
jgi:hypothetical protein